MLFTFQTVQAVKLHHWGAPEYRWVPDGLYAVQSCCGWAGQWRLPLPHHQTRPSSLSCAGFWLADCINSIVASRAWCMQPAPYHACMPACRHAPVMAPALPAITRSHPRLVVPLAAESGRPGCILSTSEGLFMSAFLTSVMCSQAASRLDLSFLPEWSFRVYRTTL